MVYNTHLYEFTFKTGKTGQERKIVSHDLKDGKSNLKTFLFARNVLWDEEWHGYKVLSDGLERASQLS